MRVADVAIAETRREPWTLSQMPDQAGRLAVVTGANSGLGFLTVRELARRGADVVMTARDADRGERALARLRAELPGAKVMLRRLDLADLANVAAFADWLVAEGRQSISSSTMPVS